MISHLNESEYRFHDGKLHFIIDYPTKDIYNSWSQLISPYDDVVPEGTFKATGFEPNETKAPYAYEGTNGYWGGLVKNTIIADNHDNSLLDGIPGHSNWFYAIGMLCDTYDTYLNGGIPDNGALNPRVRLFVRMKKIEMNFEYYFIRIRCTCQTSYFPNLISILMLQVLINT